ncbi:MAG: acyl-CoA dehydratase activase [Sphaerochaetaceae bacterium]|nr:acyl-CoA dehydratase activase [Sphaerochaetaceae bacterium]MDD4006340.1 acyl-CoA dehydratase activase [Sphaerochaetaceae bacterium]MDD4396049.1 acyl-CoA dehydratase activase [Sphaerochaetaceae bacterium]
MLRVGIDVGSTTLKCIALDENGNLVFSRYQRHMSKIRETSAAMISELTSAVGDQTASIGVSGSAGMGMAQDLGLAFSQEVYAERKAVLDEFPDASVVIELGGEDAKILFLKGQLEVRMNGSCAGGTGAFIDQMASLLNVPSDKIEALAHESKQCYTIASRCGVFAKTDVQALISQGAKTEDIAYSVLQSVVNQTISGLAQGRRIDGQVVYLGGPLTFIPTLRSCFDKTLGVSGVCPANSLYFVAIGTALLSEGSYSLSGLRQMLENYVPNKRFTSLKPLFETDEDYQKFKARHGKDFIPVADSSSYKGNAYVGIDVGSTTVKVCVVSSDKKLLYYTYQKNNGTPVTAVKDSLLSFMEKYPDIHIVRGCSTGYGENLAKAAFGLSDGIVETVAHLYGARFFYPEVDFIIDIGGQDIKCFKVNDGVIDDIFLNEACSSGCGSFLQTFFGSLGYTAEEASALALKARHPVNLGSRCTVFMNSLVKQAQKDGASVPDIFAGLAISVVKNALYKVIRCSDPSKLGKHIVVQGGTFLNDAVLRSFEQELGLDVVRPDKAELMGAFGCALYSLGKGQGEGIITLEELQSFQYSAHGVVCQGCTNHCQLMISTFSGGRRFVSGNKCERMVNPSAFIKNPEELDMYAFKQQYMAGLDLGSGQGREKIGIPMVLNMWELLPFWSAFLTSLGYEVVVSDPSSRQTYLDGQMTIPSDTICYPAKLVHGHVQNLADKGVKKIFYPCSSYNIDEKKGDNHFNCPVVAYYPEVLRHNIPFFEDGSIELISPYVSIARPVKFIKRMHECLGLPYARLIAASDLAYEAYRKYIDAIRMHGKKIIANASERSMPIFVLAGRPYHADKEVNHGLDGLILQCGAAVLSEDSVAYLEKKQKRNVLNQWTYHARMYDSARYVLTQPDMNLIQLVSFGCGLDAVTSDEVRKIINNGGKIYTQLKIDEIANLGAVKIRVRSLLATLDDNGRGEKK